MATNGLNRQGKGVLAIPSRIIATCFALTSFAMATAVGVAAQNPPATVLWRAILIMIGAWFVGAIVGEIAQRAMIRNIEQYKQSHPIPNNIEDVRRMNDEPQPQGDSARRTAAQG